ncbi:hypothetical protein [Salinigranum salinum]|uniref:hypothetical protein n=1 Tax=Salinigranum salinum TaxID=1364937 RepID=UPI0012604C83|nr:hypothetical protein [Salinigranum salinum]
MIVELRDDALSWAWFTVGFISFLVAGGPVTRSIIGQSVGDWFRAIDPTDRGLVVLLFAIVVWAIYARFDVPSRPITSFTVGLMCAIGLLVLTHVLIAGRPERWGVGKPFSVSG